MLLSNQISNTYNSGFDKLHKTIAFKTDKFMTITIVIDNSRDQAFVTVRGHDLPYILQFIDTLAIMERVGIVWIMVRTCPAGCKRVSNRE